MTSTLINSPLASLLDRLFELSKVIKTRQHLVEGGVDALIEIREGDALKTLATDVELSIRLA